MGRTRTTSLALIGAAALVAGGVPAFAQSPAASMAAPMTMDELVAAAQAEGELTVIALPFDWCNYGGASRSDTTKPGVIDSFAAKYGIKVNELNPGAGSGDEIEAIKANKDNPGPQSPDVIDVGLSFGPSAKAEGLIQPYKVATWDDIPDTVKDADGYWYGDYYGVLAIETNKSIVANPPTSFADLTKPEYANQVALPGDPNVSNQAIAAVYASSLANGGSLDDASKGLEFWKGVAEAGNFVPTIAATGTIDQGATPITLRWSYNALAHRDAAATQGTEIVVSLPTDTPPFAGVYVQAISAYAPHPNAAKLWMEFLYSDEGQNLWLDGYCYPARFDAMKAAGAIPEETLAKLPDATGAVFPTLEQLDAAKALITAGWNTEVGVTVQ